MSLYKDTRTGIYYISYISPSGKRVRKSLQTRNRVVAALKESEVLTKRKAQDNPDMLFAVFLERYREFLKATRSKETCQIFEIANRKLSTFKQIKRLEELTPTLLDDLLISLKNKGAGPAGINRSIRALRAAAKQAEYWHILSPQDWSSMIKLHEKKHRVEFHTIEEIQTILSVFKNTNDLIAALLACQAGLRRAEVAHAKWKDIDFNLNQIYVPANKTDEFRHIPLTPTLKKALLKAKSLAKSEYVVDLEGNRENKDFVSSYYKYHTQDLPFHCFFHKLRHTFASHLVQNGADLYYVSKLMGHSSIKMTEKYAHLSQHNLVSTMQLLPQPTLKAANTGKKAAVSKSVSTPSINLS